VNIGYTLRVLRRATGLQQKDLANLAGISTASLCLYESNKREVSVSMLRKLSCALCVPLSAFLIQEEEEDWTDLMRQENERVTALFDCIVRDRIHARFNRQEGKEGEA
jgi:transcriptional regulator with XRE-family HTH domain